MIEADDQNFCLLIQSEAEEGQGQINVEIELQVFYANCKSTAYNEDTT